MGADGESEVLLDLLGDPVRPLRDPRGRPAYAKNKENQLLVIQYRGMGCTEAEIATLMGCDPKTLRKHFSRELDHGALFLDSLMVQVLVKKALEGNVGAAKAVREMTQARAQKGAGKPVPKVSALGKKAITEQQAKVPPQAWGDLLDGEAPVQ